MRLLQGHGLVETRGMLLPGHALGGDPISALFAVPGRTGWRYPLTLDTLFQDAAGTTPVTAPGDPVGLVLDTSRGLALGAEKAAIATASTAAGTNPGAPAGKFLCRRSADATQFYRAAFDVGTFSANATILLSVTIEADALETGNTAIWAGETAVTIGNPGNYTLRVRADSLGRAFIQPNPGNSFLLTIHSARELPGVHKAQSTALNRLTYGIQPFTGIRNLLTRTEEFDNAVWSAGASNVTYSANAGASPLGNTTADRIVSSDATWFARNSLTLAAAAQTFSVWVKSNTGSSQNFGLYFSGASNPVGSYTATTEWQRFTLTGTIVTTSSGVGFYNGTSGQIVDLLIWGAQLELGSTATAYQRVGNQYDVTEAGVSSIPYLAYNGSNSSMATASFAWGSDKATICVGVRKLSDAGTGILMEFSASVSANQGTFFIAAPRSNATADYGLLSRGSSTVNATSAASFASPITNVVSGIADISGDVARLRLNGVQVAETLTDQGTGNYGTYQLFWGARAGTSLFLNGREYPSIGINAALTASELASVEAWVTARTGALG